MSKASRVAAHRDKLTALARLVDLEVVVPERWGRQPLELGAEPGTWTTLPAWLHGHNHLHVYRALGALMGCARLDLVHLDEEPYSAVTLQGALLSRRRGLPFVFFSWQNLNKRLPPPFGSIRRHVFSAAAGGIAGTDAAAAVLRSNGFRGPLAVIPQMGIDPDRFRPDPESRLRRRHQLGIGEDAPVVVYAGRLVPEKGVDVLLTALAGVRGLVLVVVGGGPELPRLTRLSEELDVAPRTRFVGAVPSLEVPGWLAAADVLALPSRTTATWAEQFGRALVEAMACGLPVVASDSGEIARVVGPGGVVVPEGDAGALARALRELVERPSRRRELGCAGRARVLDRFTQDRVAEDTVGFYERLVAAGVGA